MPSNRAGPRCRRVPEARRPDGQLQDAAREAGASAAERLQRSLTKQIEEQRAMEYHDDVLALPAGHPARSL